MCMLSNEQIISLILLYISFNKMVAIAYLDFNIVAETSISITEVSTSANGPNRRAAKQSFGETSCSETAFSGIFAW